MKEGKSKKESARENSGNNRKKVTCRKVYGIIDENGFWNLEKEVRCHKT